VQLKTNWIPNGLIPLEPLFDHDDKSKETSESDINDEPFVEINVGTKESPRLVKIGKACIPSEQGKIIELI
jgi:hypothetical protein